LDRQTRFLDLALERPLTRDVEVADELLRDRRATLDDPARAEVLDRGADDPLVVDSAVLVEAPVLDRHGGLRHPGTHPRELDRLAVLVSRDCPQQRAVGGVDEGVCRPALRSSGDRPQLGEAAAGLERSGAAEPDGGDPSDYQYE